MSNSGESSMKEKKIRGILFVIAMPEEGMRVLKTLELKKCYDDLYFSMYQKCFGSVEVFLSIAALDPVHKCASVGTESASIVTALSIRKLKDKGLTADSLMVISLGRVTLFMELSNE